MLNFAHHRLDAYHVALDLALDAVTMTRELPKGHTALTDQLKRSATSVVLLIAEGANRVSAAQKRQRFIEARGECGEAAAAIELLTRLVLVADEPAQAALRHADRVAAMLSGLLRKFG